MMYSKMKLFFLLVYGGYPLSLISCAEQEQLHKELEVLKRERSLLMEEIKKWNDNVPSEVCPFHSLYEPDRKMVSGNVTPTFRGSPALLQMPYWICLDDY